ncbi:hypothetical protein NL676_009594 [Syzygium grande]|nr:hypothetical protein NL676_009594 [Syzygium grande]
MIIHEPITRIERRRRRRRHRCLDEARSTSPAHGGESATLVVDLRLRVLTLGIGLGQAIVARVTALAIASEESTTLAGGWVVPPPPPFAALATSSHLCHVSPRLERWTLTKIIKAHDLGSFFVSPSFQDDPDMGNGRGRECEEDSQTLQLFHLRSGGNDVDVDRKSASPLHGVLC